jgi:hypothetical protein
MESSVALTCALYYFRGLLSQRRSRLHPDANRSFPENAGVLLSLLPKLASQSPLPGSLKLCSLSLPIPFRLLP